MLLLVMILVNLYGVFAQISNWAVFYPPSNVCAVRGFNATMTCNYSYPQGNKVERMLWCSMNNNNDVCDYPPYVYESNSSTTSNFVYAGNNKSDCTLIIHNVQSNHSGVYRFRFITDKDKWTGLTGVNVEVSDLKVSQIRISGNGTIKPGDSLNLTCDVTCTHSSSQFVWSKNNERLNESGPVLHFPNLTVGDSGNYTCTWTSNENWGSNYSFLSVKAESNPGSLNQIIAVIVGVILIILAVTAMVYWRRQKVKPLEENNEKSGEKTQVGDDNTQMKPQLDEVPQLKNTIPKEEVTYATVSINVHQTNKGYVNDEDPSTIYSTLQSTF